MPRVSIVIPAHDSAATLGATLESVRAQSQQEWEAIVVDDGSADETSVIAAAFAADDTRIRTIRQAQSGAAAARNAGLAQAGGDWVIFLDSDDRLLPHHLQTMLDAVAFRSDIGLFHCGWRRILQGEPWYKPHLAKLIEEPFLTTARFCPFAIHAAMVRRSVLEAVGGFDPALTIGEDWDLWQRIARIGTGFAPVDGVTADVFMREGSLSSDTARHLRDGLQVIRQGHARDERVVNSDPRYVEGAPLRGLPAALWFFALWMAGAALGRGQDAVHLLQQLGEPCPPDFDIALAAGVIEDGIIVGAASTGAPWPDLWLRHGERIEALLTWLDSQPLAPQLGSRLRCALEEIVVPQVALDRTATIGRYHVQALDLARPIEDLLLPGVNRLRCTLFIDGQQFGTFEQACSGAVSATTLKGRVLEHFVSPELRETLFRSRAGQADLQFAAARAGGLRGHAALLRQKLRERFGLAPLRSWTDRLRAAADFETLLLRAKPSSAEALAVENRVAQVIEEETAAALAARNAAPADAVVPKQPEPTAEHDFGTEAYWETVFDRVDPWGYRNDYETEKYRQTLDLISGLSIGRALEIACAEGIFTAMLAPHVGQLLATDIASSAVARASEACAGIPNITFARLDLARDEPPDSYDLIVCSEVLYYLPDRETLARFAAKMARHLNPGGSFVLAHANLLVDEPAVTGFGWPHPFGANGIGEVLSTQPDLVMADETWTPLYRIQRFQKHGGPAQVEPKRTIASTALRVPARVAAQVQWRGGQEVPPADSWHDFPILMYHRIAEDGPADLARFRTKSADFAAQLAYLRDNGWVGVTLPRLIDAVCNDVALPERAVMLTFDDATTDFLTEAVPLMHRYSFPATLFVPVGKIGGVTDWDTVYGPPAPVLGWDDLRLLRHYDVSIGAHGHNHLRLPVLRAEEAARELIRSRLALEAGLEQPIIAVAYPFCETSPAVRDIAKTSGYNVGMGCQSTRVGRHWDPLNLPRIEITADMDLSRFARTIEPAWW